MRPVSPIYIVTTDDARTLPAGQRGRLLTRPNRALKHPVCLVEFGEFPRSHIRVLTPGEYEVIPREGVP